MAVPLDGITKNLKSLADINLQYARHVFFYPTFHCRLFHIVERLGNSFSVFGKGFSSLEKRVAPIGKNFAKIQKKSETKPSLEGCLNCNIYTVFPHIVSALE